MTSLKLQSYDPIQQMKKNDLMGFHVRGKIPKPGFLVKFLFTIVGTIVGTALEFVDDSIFKILLNPALKAKQRSQTDSYFSD